MDLYDTLGVEKDEIQEKISERFLKLAPKVYPALGDGGNEEEFDALCFVFTVLFVATLRTAYDEGGLDKVGELKTF